VILREPTRKEKEDTMRRITGPAVLACALAVACGDSPTAVAEQDGSTPSFDALGNSGCYMVEFYQDWELGEEAVYTGDLAGYETAGSWGPRGKGVTGKVFHEVGDFTLYVTDSVVPDLIDEEVDLAALSVYTFLAPGQAPDYRMNGSMKMYLDGVWIGNFTVHGTLTHVPWAISWTAKGKVCM